MCEIRMTCFKSKQSSVFYLNEFYQLFLSKGHCKKKIKKLWALQVGIRKGFEYPPLVDAWT